MKKYWSKQIIIIIIGLFWGSSTIFAQTNRYECLSQYPTFDSLRVHQLHFRFENHNFFKNNEYKFEDIDGYTLTGLWVRPIFEYYPTTNVKIRAGGHILRYHGGKNIDKQNSMPYYSIQYNPTKNIEIILGNFDQSATLKMPEMMYSSEFFIYKKPPGGIQIRYKNNFMQSNIWLDWENFIFEDDPNQEIITQGTSIDFTLIKNKCFQLLTPIHFTFHHHGGEINKKLAPIETLFNASMGVKSIYKIAKWETGIEVDFMKNNETTTNNLQPFSSGYGGLAKGYLKINNFSVSAAYWQAYKYLSPKGTPIYQSYISNKPENNGEKRKVIESQFIYNKSIKSSIQFAIEAEAYYDLSILKFSHVYGIHLIFSESFFIHKFRKSQ